MANPFDQFDAEPAKNPFDQFDQPAGDTFADRFTGERPLPPPFLDRIIRGFSEDDPQKVVDQAKREGLSTPLFPETIGRFARGTYESVVGAVTAPEKAMQGKLDTDSPEAVQQAANIAMMGGMRFSRTVGGAPIMPNVEGAGRQVIGTLPRDEDFATGATVLKSAAAEPNLRTLWEERGIHPAEAVHDAQGDAFLRDELTTPTVSPGYEHLEPTKTAPVVGSPMPEGTPRTALARTGDPLIDRILQHPTVQRVIDNAVVDDTRTIPNSWGGSVPFEDPTLFRDKDFPKSMTVDGVTFDTADPAAVHENVEAFVIDALTKAGWSPAKALKVGFWEFGEKVEDAVYRAHGMDPKHVEDALAPYVDQIAARKITGFHGTDQPITDVDLAFGSSRGGVPEDKGVSYFSSNRQLAESYGKNVIQKIIDTGNSGTFDVTQLVNDPLFLEDMKRAHFEIATRNDFLAERAKTPEGQAAIERGWRRELGRLKDKDEADSARNDIGQVRYSAPITSAIIKRARAQGLDVAIVKNMAEGHGPASDQYIILNHRAFEGGDIPSNLFRDTYPGSDPRKAAPGPIDKPTAAEVKEAREIIAKHLDDEAALMQATPTESVRAAAVKVGGKIYEGAIHTDAYEAAAKDLHLEFDDIMSRIKPENEGFTSTTGRFLSREEAVDLAKANGQIAKDETSMDALIHKGAMAGADVTRPENLPTWDEQPPPRPGELVRTGRAAMDGLYSFARNAGLATNPMAMGTKPTMVIAKDAISAIRRVDYEHLRWHQEATRRFSAEQLYRMYNALDEESVLQQEGKTNENMGLATLTRDERNFVEYSMDGSKASWMHNIEVGNVEGEGLPAYAPRIMLNMAAAVDQAGPRALNELGRNVFTRTAQMMKRGNLLAEETEAAAKQLVRSQMEKRGATPEEIEAALEKVTLARDIRTLGWATARMEKAAIWTQMIKNFEEYGKNIGQPMVVDGERPSPEWFTIAGNPAFKKWKVLGTDADGNPIGTTVDRWLHPDAKGPVKSILEESSWGSKLDQKGLNLYGAAMVLKGKTMTAIMNNPVMHNLVVYSKVLDAVGLKEWGGIHLYFRGNQLKVAYPRRVGDLIDAGLNPLGSRGFIQDITAAIGEPGIGEAPGHSWSAKIARAIPDFFDPAKPGQTVGGAGDKIATLIDKMGDFYHNTLLWDRVSDLHFGLADFMSDRLVGEGHDRVVADRIASQFSNLVVGSIPKEAMSAGARQTMNMLLFSRSFTAGNWGMVKQALVGLPKPIAAQIERDLLQVHGFSEPEIRQIQSGEYEASPEVTAKIETAMRSAKGAAQWKAITSIGMSFALMYIGQAVLQNGFNVLRFDHSVNDETQGYVRRFQDWWKDLETSKDPGTLLGMLNHLSPTYDNEPGKNNRVKVGYASDGTAIYTRPFFGKIGEELLGVTDPLDAMRAKMNPMEVRAPLEVLFNDQGFDRKVRDPNAEGLFGYVMNFVRGLFHIIKAGVPEGQIEGAHDLIMGEGDKTVNELRAFGPFAAFTSSKGRAGGTEKGEMGAVRGAMTSRFDLAWPDLRRQINRGDEEGAKQWMRQNGVPERGNWPSINLAVRAAKNPSFVSPTATKNFMRTATPAEIERFLRAQGEDMRERARQAP